MIRGRFCSAVASLLMDGLKLPKLVGLIQHDVWKVINSFCQEGKLHMIIYTCTCTCTCTM